MTTPAGAVAGNAQRTSDEAARRTGTKPDSIFTKKYGPLPGWGWMAAAGGVALVYFYWKRRKSEQATTGSAATVTTVSTGSYGMGQGALQREISGLQGSATAVTSTGGGGSGGGSGGGGGGTTAGATTTTTPTSTGPTTGKTTKSTHPTTSKTTKPTTKKPTGGTGGGAKPYPAPVNLHITGITATTMDVAWDAIPDNKSGYVVNLERNSKTVRTDTVGPAQHSKKWTNLAKDSSYTVRVRGARPGSAEARVIGKTKA